ncbi:MAG: heparin lyase I family protein [Cyclobacteriaceae bacterium]
MFKSIAYACTGVVLVGCSFGQSATSDNTSGDQNNQTNQSGNITDITWRLSAQKDLATTDQIIDNTFIPIGDPPPRGTLQRNTLELHNGVPVYHFAATGEVNRIELTTAFGSEENTNGYSQQEIEDLLKIADGYIDNDQGQYGDLITYEWYARFPEQASATKGGIFAQWHGRPDRTLIKDPNGNIMKLSIPQFISMLDTMYFDKHTGKNLTTHEPNGWEVDAAAGGPIGAFHYRPPYMYLIVRSDAHRMSESVTRVKPKPGKHLGVVIGQDGKTGTIAFERLTSEVPINKWIHFKVQIRYSEYSHEEDMVLSPGHIKVWIDDEMVTDMAVNIGKNDELGPYFKFGIYKPWDDGFKVDCSGFKQTIE